MIITCPECAARYDVDDDRFSPNGRSVRCTACGESWYVPAPEPLDMAPLEDLKPSRRAADKGAPGAAAKKSAARLKVRGIEEPDAAFDDPEFDDTDEDDSLFDDPAPEPAAAKAEGDDLPRDERGRFVSRKKAEADDAEAPVEKGWRKGKQFIVEDDDEDAAPPRRSLFKRRKRRDDDEDRAHAGDARRDRMREALRFSDAAPDPASDPGFDDADADDDDLYENEDRRRNAARFSARRRMRGGFDEFDERADDGAGDRKAYDRDAYDGPYHDDYDADGFDARFDDDLDGDFEDDFARARDAEIVDADFEDVADFRDGVRPRGFGRRVRAERRRATAVARVEDVNPFSAEYFDEEFFASLRVTPRELERALRKARRRAESREKNRMTPWRAFGWTAWAAMVAGVIYVGVNYRDDIVRIAPQAADAYAVIGIETNPSGLSIDNVRHRLAMSTSGPTIEITGSLRNDTGADADAPLLQAEALGARGELLSRWTFSASEAAVSEGTSVDFVTRAPAPEGVAEVALSFAPLQGGVRELLTVNR